MSILRNCEFADRACVGFHKSGRNTGAEMQTKRDESEYPTDAQMREMFAALESGDDQAILAVLQKRRKEREEAEAENAKGSDRA